MLYSINYAYGLTLKQKIIPFEKHQLPNQKVDSHALMCLKKLRKRRIHRLSVGGSVRDLLLNRTPKGF